MPIGHAGPKPYTPTGTKGPYFVSRGPGSKLVQPGEYFRIRVHSAQAAFRGHEVSPGEDQALAETLSRHREGARIPLRQDAPEFQEQGGTVEWLGHFPFRIHYAIAGGLSQCALLPPTAGVESNPGNPRGVIACPWIHHGLRAGCWPA